MNLKRPLYGPQDPRGPSRGRDVKDFVKRSLHKVETDFFPKPPGGYDDVYNAKVVEAMKILQRANGIKATGNMGAETFDLLWREYADAYARWVYRLYRPPNPVPDLGPVWQGGVSVLDHDLTHVTSGIDFFPAFDDAFREGVEIIAPEALWVERESSSRPGLAFYATGKSKLRYWFGHLDRTHKAGVQFVKGALVGKTCPNAIGGGPHAHIGLNVELLLGKGAELIHRTDYRHGAPTVREQLTKALS